MSKKVYLYKAIRAEMGLEPGWTYDEDGNLIRYAPPEPITYERLQELRKEREANERTERD